MSELFTKTPFLLVFILSLSFQPASTRVYVPDVKIQLESHFQDASEALKGKSPEKTDKMLQFTSGGHILGFRKGDVLIASGDHALRIEFVNARRVSPLTEKTRLDAGNSLNTQKPLGRIVYRNLWDGVTLVYERHSRGVAKSTYTVQPYGTGSSSPVERIRLRYNVPVEVDEAGDLVFRFEMGEMRESHPMAWQEIAGKRIPVDVSFRSLGKYEVGFKVGSYNLRFPLVIDPMLIWHTFMGSAAGDDFGKGIAVDRSGNVYVAGYSYAGWGKPINLHAGGSDAFIAKLNSNGVRQWHTFMGSSLGDVGNGIAVDGSGNVYVVGFSIETWGLPVNAHAGSYDVFVAKLNSSGGRIWHTFMGSSLADSGNGIAVDGSGNVYVVGESYATWGTPVIAYAGGGDAFAAILDSSGVLQFNTFMGSPSTDHGKGIAVDGSGNVYVVGESYATWGTPIDAHSGDSDAFALKLNQKAVKQWHTFMGSSSADYGWGIAVDGSGNVYVVGDSLATWGLPVNAYGGSHDVFVAKLNSSGGKSWNTFIGNLASLGFLSANFGRSISVDGSGNVFLGGYSLGAWGTPGGYDAFAVKLNSRGGRLWITHMGSTAIEKANGIAVDGFGNVFVAGEGQATWGTPVNAYAGGYDAFVAKIYDMSIHVFGGHDFNGSGSSDVSVFRPSNGRWYIRGVGDYVWGTEGDTPVNGDYDGDGTTDIAVWRPSNGRWYIRGSAGANWGTAGDIPVPGNYDGDMARTTEIAVWRPSNGRWYIKGVAGSVWGTAGDTPVPGDYDGDGATDIAVWRPSNGRWYIKGVAGSVWGAAGDVPIPGDYDGDGTTDIAVWRPSNGRWYIKGVAGSVWGTVGDVPVPGDYDGDGATDIAVWRPSNGRWYIKGIGSYTWGLVGDIPLVR